MQSNTTYTYPTTQIPYQFILPWDHAWPSYFWGFYAVLVLSSLGVLLNLLTLLLLISKESATILESFETKSLIMMLVVSDFGGSLSALVSSIGSLVMKEWFGTAVGCKVFSFLLVFWVLSTLITLNLMAGHLMLKVTRFKKNSLPLIKMYLVGLVLDFIICFIVTVNPGESKLYASGITCVPKCTTPTYYVSVVFFVFLLLSIVFIYIKIYRFYVINYQKSYDNTGELSDKKKKLLWRFSLFIGFTLLAYIPYLVEVLYTWVTGFYAPPEFTIFVAFVVYLQNVMNPVLYFYSNEAAMKALKFKSGMTTKSKNKEDNQSSL